MPVSELTNPMEKFSKFGDSQSFNGLKFWSLRSSKSPGPAPGAALPSTPGAGSRQQAADEPTGGAVAIDGAGADKENIRNEADQAEAARPLGRRPLQQGKGPPPLRLLRALVGGLVVEGLVEHLVVEGLLGQDLVEEGSKPKKGAASDPTWGGVDGCVDARRRQNLLSG